MHVHLVAHSRKGKDEKEIVGKLDVKGSSDITNQADNVITVWRNKKKEEQRAANQLSEDDEGQQPDAVIFCDKQRDTGWEGKIPFWFFTKLHTFARRSRDGKYPEFRTIGGFPRPEWLRRFYPG